MSWAVGTWLVARRHLVENLRSRTFKVVTGVLLLVSIAAVVVPQLLRADDTTYSLATVGPVPTEIRTVLDSAAQAGGFTVEYRVRADDDALQVAVRDGDVSAGLGEGVLYTSSQDRGTFPVLVAQAVVSAQTTARLLAAGLTPQQVAEVKGVRAPRQVELSRVDDESRAAVGFAVGIALYLAITFAGNGISTAVATEKSTRISEVLLAVLRPTQILVGTVVAVGTAILLQLLLLATPLAVAVQVSDSLGLPAIASGDLALAVVWFVLGFALYAFLFAAAGSLVDKLTDAAAAVTPVTTVLVIAYLLAVTVVGQDPSSWWSVAISMFPLSAPLAMPVRWASGEVPVYQLVLAMMGTAAAAGLMVLVASAIYQRALLITGRRVRLRELAHRQR